MNEKDAEIVRLRRILERSTADFMALATEEAGLRVALLRLVKAQRALSEHALGRDPGPPDALCRELEAAHAAASQLVLS